MLRAPSSQTSLFGIELADLWKSLTRPWAKLRTHAAVQWLVPEVPVRLIQADGQESFWAGDRQVERTGAGILDFVAVELPEERCLRRRLSLPPMDLADLREAVALDVQSASPFALTDLVWGYRVQAAGGQQTVDAALASRPQIAQYLEGLRSRLPAGAEPEVWVRAEGRPIMLAGFGEGRRAEHVDSRWRLGVSLVLLAAGLLTAIAVTPTVQLRQRAIQATRATEEAARRVQPLLRKREQMVQAASDVALLNAIMAQRVEPAYVVDQLTRIIPDDTSLLTLNVQGNKVVLMGQTANAASLMQRLSSETGLRDVRAPSPAIRPLGATKETFTVEFTFDSRPPASPLSVSPAPADSSVAPVPSALAAPDARTPASGPGGSDAGGRPGAVPPSGAPAANSAIAGPPAATVAPVQSPPPQNAGGFTIGGRVASPVAPAASAASTGKASR
jgi:general secretion pathway protein L